MSSGGNSGDNVGSLQSDNFASHTHSGNVSGIPQVSATAMCAQSGGLDYSDVFALRMSYTGGAFPVSSALKGFLGDGSSTSFNISVPIDDVVVSVRDASSGEFVGVHTSVSGGVVNFSFILAPSSNQYKYCIIPAY